MLGALITALGDAIREGVESAAEYGGETPAALIVTFQFEDLSVGALGQWLGLSQPAGVRLLDRLAADNLLVRRRGRDGRTVNVGITEAGRTRAREILNARQAALDGALEALTHEEQAELSTLLEKMLRHLTPDVPQARLTCRMCHVAACPQDRCPVTLGARDTD